ncbi:MAG: sulfotransferase domain-containing protein [Chloroflexota bacterium]
MIEPSQERLDSASLRRLPGFVIIGAQECGTTSLYRALISLPGCRPATRKELVFFSDPRRRPGADLDVYRACFPLESGAAVSGEASPGYLPQPEAARRLAAALPDARVIVLLRNPADRAHSHWRHVVRAGREPRAFEDAVIAGPRALLDDEGWATSEGLSFGYVPRGVYAPQPEPWLAAIPPANLRIVRSEDSFEDSPGTVRALARFIGLDEPPPESLPERRSAVPQSTMDPETRAILSDWYVPHNRRLYDLIGRDVGWEGS